MFPSTALTSIRARIGVVPQLDTLDTELVASFAIDELLDYRSRRPLMTFTTDHFTKYDDPELNLYALHDTAGTPFLLLAGMLIGLAAGPGRFAPFEVLFVPVTEVFYLLGTELLKDIGNGRFFTTGGRVLPSDGLAG